MKPRPLLGLVLGLLLGLLGVGLLWQLGVTDPGRTVLFGVTAITGLLVALLLTRVPGAARGRFTAAAVIAGMLGGISLLGIPEAASPGSISNGCTLEVTSGETVASPADTSALSPLDLPADGIVTWTATSETPVSVETREAGLLVGGFTFPIRTVTEEGASEVQEVTGEVDVAEGLSWISDRTWFELTGTYHAYGTIAGGSVECSLDGYVRVEPAGLFATNTLIVLWILLGIVLLLIAWGAFVVRRSFKHPDTEEAEPSPYAPPAADGQAAEPLPTVAPVEPPPTYTPQTDAKAEPAVIAPPPEDAVRAAEEPKAPERRSTWAPAIAVPAMAAPDLVAGEDESSGDEPAAGAEEDPADETADASSDEASDEASAEASAEAPVEPMPAADAVLADVVPDDAGDREPGIVPADDEGPEPTPEDEDSGPKP